MAKKELGLDNQGIQKTMSLSNYLGDGTGQIALNCISGLTGMLTYFYTDKVGITAAAAGTIILIAKFFDAFVDLFMGFLVDRTNTRFGKARPWIIAMAPLVFIAIVALFLVPQNASAQTKFIFALATTTFSTAVVYTGIAIPYMCLMSFITKSSEERSKMGIFRMVFGYLFGMVIAIALVPITNAFGGEQKAWIIVAAVFGVISTVSLIITFFANKEQGVTDKSVVERDGVPFFESVRLLFKNRYWVIMLFVMLFSSIMFTISSSSVIYYTKWILGDENLIALLGGVGLIPVFIGFAVLNPMFKKFGLANTVRIALVIGIVGSIVRVFFPYNIIVTLVFGGLVSFGTFPLMAVGQVMVINTADYGELKFGKRIVGMTNSANAFSGKVGSGLGAALIGWILAFGQYKESALVQPESALTSIIGLTIWIPGILFALMLIALTNYDLDKQHPQIVKELEERHNK